MLPMGEGPFPYARDSLYRSKPVRPRKSQSLRCYCKNLSYSSGIIAGPAIDQFTNRRMRTFITIPSARNVNRTDEPP
jgi:hypothetical protein